MTAGGALGADRAAEPAQPGGPGARAEPAQPGGAGRGGRARQVGLGDCGRSGRFGSQREPVPGYGIHAAGWAELDGLIRASLDRRAESGMAARNDGGSRP
jgi:hypothetical protein